MKCGIITFHRAINYGGVLQAYALQQSLKKLGVEVEIIDYYCPSIESLYRPTFKNRLSKQYIKRLVAAVLKKGTISFNNKDFAAFRDKYLSLSNIKYYSEAELKTSNYDIYITGSDQVWSPYCAGFDSAYFLSFVEEQYKKNAYAASFGVGEIPEELHDEYRKRLQNFNRITLREESGCRIIQQLLEQKTDLVPDPTLLLSKEEWSSILPTDSLPVQDYVLVYMLAADDNLIKKAAELARKENLKVCYINDRLCRTRNAVDLRKVSPQYWVKLFMNAKYVFTNSFHGIAFSINFGVPLCVHELKQNTKTNSRINNILNRYRLSDCINQDHPTATDNQYIKKELEKDRTFGLAVLSDILAR